MAKTQTQTEIVFTVTTSDYCLLVSTTSRLADEEDKHTTAWALGLYDAMQELTKKYNALGIAVLFDVA